MSKNISDILGGDSQTGKPVETDARILYNSRNKNLDYVFALADTDTRRFRVGKANDKDVYLRVLSNGERILVEALVQEAKAIKLKINSNYGTIGTIEANERAIITLMMASCPEKCSVYDNLGTVNDKSRLKYADLSDLADSEIFRLFQAHLELENSLNITIDKLSPADLNFIIEDIKKKAIPSTDLNWQTLTQIVEYLASKIELGE